MYIINYQYSLALKILKKHYNSLWRSFPDDYMPTLTTMCEECKVSEGIIDLVTSYSTPERCNQEILDYIIFMTKGDEDIMAFSGLMGKFITDPRLSKIVNAFSKGTYIYVHKYICYVCMDIHMHACFLVCTYLGI